MYRLICLCFLLSSSLALASDKELVFVADPWCPWNCDGIKETGIAVDLAKAIYEPLGYNVQYKTIPWARAVKLAESGEVTGVIGATGGNPETIKLIFPKTPLSSSNDVLVAKEDSKFAYNGIKSLEGKTIGIIAEYHYQGELGTYIDSHYENSNVISQTHGNDGVIQSLQKLLANRIDLYLDDKYVIKYTAQKYKIADQIKIVNALQENTSNYIAFAPLPQAQELAKFMMMV